MRAHGSNPSLDFANQTKYEKNIPFCHFYEMRVNSWELMLNEKEKKERQWNQNICWETIHRELNRGKDYQEIT